MPWFDDEFTVDETRIARAENGRSYVVEDMSYSEWKEKFVDGVDIGGKSGIIELNRRNGVTHRHIEKNGQQIIDKPTYNKLTKKFIRHGGIIIRGEAADKHLGEHYHASYLPSFNAAIIRDDATVSDVLEEMYHAKQDRLHMFGEITTQEVRLRREIDAQKYLLSMTDKYKIPQIEVNTTKENLIYYEKELENVLHEKERG